jgi:hypothetical protein
MKRESETSCMPDNALLLRKGESCSAAPAAKGHANLDPAAHGRMNMNTDTEVADHERRMTMTDAAVSDPSARCPTWRDVLPIHPAAGAYPSLGEDELAELAADIGAHGLSLLDGRYRLDALERAGFVLVKDGELDRALGLGGDPRVRVVAGVDPVAFADSVNLHRRHLTREQKRARIEALLKADPEKSDRRIAREVGDRTSHTVAVVRAASERRGEITHVPVRRDTRGRRQPALKSASTPKPEPATKKLTRKEREQAWRAEVERVAAQLIALDRDLAREVHEIAIWGHPKTEFLWIALARGLGID